MNNCILICFSIIISGCGVIAPDTLDRGPRWNLDQPFYIEISPTMPKPQMVLDGMRRAIGHAGGTTTVDKNASQVIKLLDTDGDYCQKKGVEAWAVLPANGKIYFCHSNLIWASYTINGIDNIATHELGHVLANRGYHLGGEPNPGNCPSHAVMASNRTCRVSNEYTTEDLEYFCLARNTIGGMCRIWASENR